MRAKTHSWKTGIMGCLYPLAKFIQNIPDGPKWIFYFGQALEIVAVMGLGVVAKDYNVTGTKRP